MPELLSHWGRANAVIENGRIVAIEHPKDDPDPSRISENFVGVLNADMRVSGPMVRRGFLDGDGGRARGDDAFVAVSWDQVTDIVRDEMNRVISQYGNKAIFGGSYGWASAGRFHHALSQVHRFLNTCGGYVRSVNTHSFAAAEVTLPHVVGDQRGLTNGQTPWELIIGHTELFVAFGGLPRRNAQVSGGGVPKHNVHESLCKAREAGTHFINIGPLEDDAEAELQSEWIAPRMNTDVAMMLGIAHTLEIEGLVDRAFLETHATGYERFRPYLMGQTDGIAKSAEWAAAITALPAEVIRDLARRMARMRTMISMSFALQRADHGEQAVWMVITLAAMLGQIGLPGGGFGLGYSAANQIGSIQLPFSWASLPQGRNAVTDFIPVARLVDMLENPGAPFDYDGQKLHYPDIKLIWWAGGNPFHHQQDTLRLRRAWKRPEVVIVNEPFWNAQAKHADIVLPCTLAPERNDLGLMRGEGHLVAMKQMLDAHADAKSDYEIFSLVAAKMGMLDAFTEGRNEAEWLRELYRQSAEIAARHGFNMPDFDSFWEAGTFHLDFRPEPEALMQAFRQDPSANPLPTPSGKIEIFSETVAGFGYDDCPGMPTWFEPAEWLGNASADSLHLVSNQPSRRLHSQLDLGPYSADSKIAGREPARLHPDDAAQRGIGSGDLIEIASPRGRCHAGAIISDKVARGHIQMATGAWLDVGEDGVDRHGNVNVLTLDKATSRLAQGPTAHTTLVTVRRLAGEVPPVGAFVPPVIEREA